MAERYLSQEDMTRYLNQSICMYDSTPVYVSCNQLYPNIAIYRLAGKLHNHWKIIDHTDEKFCDRAPSLGYINYNKNAFYLQRMPIRNQHAGLRAETILFTPPCQSPPRAEAKEMEACILGEHPKIGEAWDRIKEQGHLGCAIHRHLAILSISPRNHGLHYKSRLVALWSNPTERWEFLQNNDTSHLERIISKLGVL